ncbi:hypothetical protein H1R20_g3245, partial [Candolleomyces eurysporus]
MYLNDFEAAQILVLKELEEEEDEEEELLSMSAAVGMMVYGAEEARHQQNEAHRNHQQYLVCSDLLPDP